MTPRVNKWLDLLDRAGWTAIQASAGAFIAWQATDQVGWEAAVTFVLGATVVSVAKVIIGQNTGSDDTGALIGQPVIEPAPVSPPK
jgi:hypothetical protein